MQQKTRDLINVGINLGGTVLTTASAMRALHDEEPIAAALLLAIAVFFAAITLSFASNAIVSAELRGMQIESDRVDRIQRKIEQRHKQEASARAAICDAINAAADRGVAAGKHADVKRVIDAWRRGQDETLTRTLRDLEALTRPVAEA